MASSPDTSPVEGSTSPPSPSPPTDQPPSSPPPTDPQPPPADSPPPQTDQGPPPTPPAPSGDPSPPAPPTPSPDAFPPSSKGSGSRTPNDSPPSRSSSRKSSNSSPGNDHESSQSNNGDLVTGIITGGVVILAVIIICVICSRRKRKAVYYMDPGRPPKGAEKYYNNPQWQNSSMVDQHGMHPPPGFMGTPIGSWGAPPLNNSGDYSIPNSGPNPMPMMAPSPNIGSMSHFTYEELAAATSGFSQANLLGQGGFGFVHKGVLPDRREVAVKSLKSGSGQGEREFQAEVEIISRVHHRHLVSLVGYCIAGGQRMLVYEFVPNNTLEFHLHGKAEAVMDWPSRLRIAIGSAKGLAYLHEDCHPRIIHRDIKAANILLDNNYEAMVADFGLAKLSSDNFTHVSTRVMGTFGYLAPEYASSGKLTEKSDVFSFGVMLLELITGRRPIDLSNSAMEDSLVDWARPLLTNALEDSNYSEVVDPRLEGKYDSHEMAHMASCAIAAIRHSARRRPRMSQIARALEGNSSLDDLNEGVKPGQSGLYNPSGSDNRQGIYDTGAYNADMIKFRKMVMSSQEFDSTQYGTND